MIKIGPDLGFLDDVKYLQSRLRNCSATNDPLLALVTPSCVPIYITKSIRIHNDHQWNSLQLRMRSAFKFLCQTMHNKKTMLPFVTTSNAQALSTQNKVGNQINSGLLKVLLLQCLTAELITFLIIVNLCVYTPNPSDF